MRILYAIQGTGNGHISRAMDVGPALEKHGEVDYLVSGAQVEISLSQIPKYRSPGVSFYFGKRGGINLSKTFMKNSTLRFYKEINDFPIDQYDLVINDFEPITAWAARKRGRRTVGLSHQGALLSDKCPKPESRDIVGKMILKNYAPVSQNYGFHFDAFDTDIYTPVVRKCIRDVKPTNKGHYTVYLPAYSDEKIIKVLSQIKGIQWQVFSKHSSKAYHIDDISIVPIHNDLFIESITSAQGVLCGAGFETPAESLYLGKKLMVIPMEGQYEQHCNAAALRKLGIPVLKKLKLKKVNKIQDWVQSDMVLQMDYPDETEAIVTRIIEKEMGYER
ncbi:glycosyltransferase family protein [Fulvivirga sediminis]|uniref:Glycosyl transferase n=1 Tax=Fulvivirga sediminis TaxID=2803949 RepID=A0A937F7B7_9BACT|nr:glycosyltransferase family protein [Fulvivirga sediminis]MBL3655949.1 glycosyl transferase [Fulvivirga sediminis]